VCEENLFRDPAVLLVVAFLGSSILYRLLRGKPIFYHRPAVVRFRECTATGSSYKNWFTKISSAKCCLVVQVTISELDIHVPFPLNLGFVPELSDLEHRVPLSRIRSARITLFGQQMFSIEFLKKCFRKTRVVEVEFLGEDGRERKMWLLLKHPEDFLAAIGKAPDPRLMNSGGRVESIQEDHRKDPRPHGQMGFSS